MTDSISLWENISRAARALNIPDMTIAQWKSRGYVPPSRHYEIITVSNNFALGLSQEELHRMWKERKPEQPPQD